MESVLGLVRHTGNDGLFRAIEMSLLAALAGQSLHIHAEGLRGTGKTTIMRAARRALPRIRRIKGCLYNCDPARPHCPAHRHLSPEASTAHGEEWVPMPFLEISHSAKVGTVAGSIDLARLVSPTQPEAALLPGSLPQAHRGIIFVDEINRLAETSPELADILLDAMGTKPGRVQIEETGLPPVELTVQVTVWAASNPDEDPGPLEDVRRQLSDRFDMVIYTDRPGEAAVVEQILAAGMGGNQARPVCETDAELFRSRLAARLPALTSVQVSPAMQRQIADLYSRFNVESLRAVQAIHLGMRLTACMEQREEAGPEDLARVTPMALRHRLDQEGIKRVTGHLAGLQARPSDPPPPAAAGVRQRLSGISFGGAALTADARSTSPVVEPMPQAQHRPDQPGPEQARPAPGRPAADSAADPRSNRLTGGAQQPQSRPGAASGQAASGASARSGRDQQNWFSRALSGLRQNLGLGMAGEAGSGRAGERGLRRAGGQGGAAPEAPSRAVGRAERASSAQPPAQMPDPRQFPPAPPPSLARPASRLLPHELIRTEEELGR